ncbi:MAG: hypothetical protein ACXW0U_06685 [Halobacteriota archaeon]
MTTAEVHVLSFGRAGLLVLSLTALAVFGVAHGGPGVGPHLASPAGRLVYLDFADGTQGVIQGHDDDATRNVSRLCGVSSFARWESAPECGQRDRCREEVLRLVREYFEPYDVRFTLSRPSPPEIFSTVVVAPPLAECTFGRRGIAFADCGNANPMSMGFVFDCHGDAASCAVMVAHEAAHTFGLVHSLDPADIMTPTPDDQALRFRAESSQTTENECGVLRQISHEALLAVLGPRKP